MVIFHVDGELTHQRSMDLFEAPHGLATGIDDMFVTRLPALELRPLAGALLAVDLEQLVRDFELLPRDLELLPLHLEGLVLEVGQEMEEEDGVIGVGDGCGRDSDPWERPPYGKSKMPPPTTGFRVLTLQAPPLVPSRFATFIPGRVERKVGSLAGGIIILRQWPFPG